MGFADDLTAQPTADEPKFTAKTEFDGRTGTIQTGALTDAPTDHRELLKKFGYDPDEVEIVGNPHISRWQTYDERWLASYKFSIASKGLPDLDLDEMVRRAAEAKPAARMPTIPRTLVWQGSDFQLGKIDGDGIEGTLARMVASRNRVIDRIIAESPEHVLLAFVGDCVEGSVSQGGRNMWRTGLTITEQVRVWRRFLFDTVEAIAPLSPTLTVGVVNGNHDQAQREPVSTRADDGWATEGAIAVSDAIKGQPAYGHVNIVVPERDKGYMTIGVGDSIFTLLHGHAFRRGKAKEWWESQAFYQDNSAGAHFMLHGHWHSTSMSQDGPRTIMCSGTYDGGSAWYRDSTGAWARQGGLCFTTAGSEFFGLELV